MRLKLILIAVLLLELSGFAVAEQKPVLFSDFCGQSAQVLMEAYGPPEYLRLYDSHGTMLWGYAAKNMLGRSYAVDFYLLGGWVFGMRCEALDAAAETVDDEFSPAQMGQGLDEVLAKEGAPRSYQAYQLYTGAYAELTFDSRVIRKQPFEKTVILEKDRVVNFYYDFPDGYKPEADVLLAFARTVDAELMAGVDKDAVWLFRDNSDRPWSEDLGPRRWGYIRFINTKDMYTDLIAFSMSRQFLLEYGDRNAHGLFMDVKIDNHDKLVLDYWQDEERQYSNSGNLEKLKSLVEARAVE